MLVLIIRKWLASLCCKELHTISIFLGMADKCSTTTGSDHLITIERHDTKVTHRSCMAAIIKRTHRLCRIFYDRDVIAFGDRENLFHAWRIAVQVYRNNSFRTLTRLTDTILYRCLQQFWRHIPRIRLTVYEDRCSTLICYRIGRSSECQTLTDHLIAFPYP